MPANLRARPTLVISLDADAPATVPMELTYLTRGLSWRADYVALLNDGETAIDLNGWVTLNNRSGTSYRNAKLQLVAGDVNQVRRRIYTNGVAKSRPRAAERRVRRQALLDYHLYTLEQPTTIKDKQQKQVALMKAAGVSGHKQYHIGGSGYYYRSRYGFARQIKATVMLLFKNDKASNLGYPLPKGVVRVYKNDKSGKAVFVGEDRIGHTADGDTVRLTMGKAFDVSGQRVQTDYRRERYARTTYETAYRITLKNAKTTPVEVLVTEPIPGDWMMVSESHRHTKINSRQVRWTLRVPAKGQTVLRYRVRVTY